MLDHIMDLVRKYTGNAVSNNPALPGQKSEAAAQQAGTSIIDTLKQALASGNIQEVLAYFKNGAQGAPQIVNEATGRYAQQLQQQEGLPADQAHQLAGQVVPGAMNELASRTADPADKSFDIQDIFNQLSGGKTSGLNIGQMLGKFGSGLDKDKDGDVDFQDLKKAFSGPGSLGDKLKGLF